MRRHVTSSLLCLQLCLSTFMDYELISQYLRLAATFHQSAGHIVRPALSRTSQYTTYTTEQRAVMHGDRKWQ